MINAAVDQANQNLSQIERVRRFVLADEPFTTANSQMTATLKARRHIIVEHYGKRLQGALQEISQQSGHEDLTLFTEPVNAEADFISGCKEPLWLLAEADTFRCAGGNNIPHTQRHIT